MGVYLGLVEDDEGVVESGESYDRAPYDRAPGRVRWTTDQTRGMPARNGDGGSGGCGDRGSRSRVAREDQGSGYSADYEEFQSYRITTSASLAPTTRHARLGNISGRAPRLS